MLELLAPAKINVGLEIIGRRSDNYHEVRTILIPVTLFDRVRIARAESSSVWTSSPSLSADDNLALRAARMLDIPVRIEIVKRIPAASGLGGASSNAAAVLRGIHELEPGISVSAVHAAARTLGTDVPFFLGSGSVLASGRGDQFSALSSPRAWWFLIAAPSIDIPLKTATLYRALQERDFSDGSRVERVAAAYGPTVRLAPGDNRNAFERPLYDQWPAARATRDALLHAGAEIVALSGAGPAHYAICDDFAAAAELAAAVRRRVDRTTRLMVCRMLSEPMPVRRVLEK